MYGHTPYRIREQSSPGTRPQTGGRRGLYSFRQEVNSPPQLLIPKTAQKKKRRSLFCPADGPPVATLLSSACSVPQARSDSSPPQGWERNFCPALGSAGGGRAQEGDQGKTPTHPTQIHWNSLAMSHPAPALLVLQCIFLGINLTPCQRPTPAEAEHSEEREALLHSAFLLSALPVSRATCYFF